MTLLDWLQSNPSVHLVSECFAVDDDLSNVQEVLESRTHLLPMSDASLFNFSLGLILAGTPTLLQWPTSDLCSLGMLLKNLHAPLPAPLIIRVPITPDSIVELHTLDSASVHSILHDTHRSCVLSSAMQRPDIYILLESRQSIELHRLENRFVDVQHDSSTTDIVNTAQCTVITSNYHSQIVEEALSNSPHIEVVHLHQLNGLDKTTVASVQRTGRVVCVGLPSSWMASVINGAFWSLEAEPEFTTPTTQSIQEALSRVFED